MSSPSSSNKPKSGPGWLYSSPTPGGPALPLNSDGTVTLAVNDNHVLNSGYRAAIYNDGDPIPPFGNCTELSRVGMTMIYSGKFAVQVPPCDNKNVIFYNDDDPNDSKATSFSVSGGPCGSGSSSGSHSDAAQGAAALKSVVQQGRPVPASLSAQFGDPPQSGGPRVEAATLVYSGATGFERCWFSQPIDLHSDGADPALWVLERADALTWLLRLRRGDRNLVVYRHTAATERDGGWPVQLGFESDGAGEGIDWPTTVTLSPAP